jgi:hypothetical protein
MIKWLTVVLGFLFGSQTSKAWNFNEIAMGIYEEALHRSRRPIAFLFLGLASVILFCGGFFMSLIDITRQFDLTGHFYPGAIFWTGAILSATLLFALSYAFSKAWTANFLDKTQPQLQTESQAPKLQEALSLLILDHIEERKFRREKEENLRQTSETMRTKKNSPEMETPF